MRYATGANMETEHSAQLTHEQAVELAKQLVDAVNAHDPDPLLAMYADDAVVVSPVAGEMRGISAIREWWKRIFFLFPDWTVKHATVLVDGERIALLGTAGATDRNGWFGLPATGEHFEYQSMIMLTLARGKIVRDERIYDLSALLQRFEKSRLDQELKIAAEVQRTLLSQRDRSTPFCEAIGASLPCRAIGGDFFETIRLPSGDFGIALGDVAGKGPGSAMLAAMIQGMLAVQFESEAMPSTTLTHLNRSLASRHLEPRFATLSYGVVTPDARFTYCNAGHNPPILLTRDGVRRLSAGGPILGTFRDSSFEQETVCLAEGDTIIMFSDGLVEARDSQDLEYGEERLIACVDSFREKPIADVLNGIYSSVQQFCGCAPQADDISALVARFSGS
jgi:serine phosphatase RsbU (regulator of sigma subunit)